MASARISIPTLLFRGAVLVGCVALAAGLVGIVYFGLAGSSQDDAAGEAVSVQLLGLEDLEGLQVVVRWDAPRGGLESEVGRAGPELGQWLFQRAPADTALTLTLYRRAGGGREVLHEQPARFAPGVDFVVHVPGGG